MVVAQLRNLKILVAGCLSLATLAGCTRSYYRQAADREGYALVDEKISDPRWTLPGDFTIEMDPRSRFYDPYDRTCPPMPPDDPNSHQLMHRVYGMHGWRYWHRNGDINNLENPGWQEYLGEFAEIEPDGSIKIKLEDAVRLAYVHSPAYQTQLETLYLAALDVSTERFRFIVQFFGQTGPGGVFPGNSTTFTDTGRDAPGANGLGRSTLTETNSITASKLFPTAGQLLVGFANTFVWQFANPQSNMTTSIANFSLIQPLLQAGGRVIGMEQLTLAERTLLGAVRSMVQYRQGFYTNIAIGDLSVSGVQRKGGFSGGTGLTGFSGSGSGGFGGVGAATGFGALSGTAGGGGGGVGAATSGLAGGGAGNVGGFIGLMQQLQQNRNLQDNLNTQLRTLSLLEANQEAGLIDIAQVDQFRQNILTNRANLVSAQITLQLNLDNLKIVLGLPPDLLISLDDSLVRQFQFIDPSTTLLVNHVFDYIQTFGKLPQEPSTKAIRTTLGEVSQLHDEMAAQFKLVADDLVRMHSLAPQRMRTLNPEEQESVLKDQRKLDEGLVDLEHRFQLVVERLRALKEDLTEETVAATADGIVENLADLSNLVNSLSLVQARARIESVILDPFEMEPADAIDIARANRLDWMNNRSSLVDTWRLIEFNANALKAGLNLVFTGDIETLGNNPFRFRAPTGALGVGLQFTPPLTRRVQRNTFRQQLIVYQQTRRNIVQFEDTIKRNLRQYLRFMAYLQLNMEIQRGSVALAVRRVDQNLEVLNQPPPPAAPGEPAAQLGPTAALNLRQALDDLRASQNNFMSVWLNFIETKMQVMREMGAMKIDANGLWIDEPIGPDLARASAAEFPLPPPVPQAWINQLDAADGGGPTVEVPLPQPAEQPGQ